MRDFVETLSVGLDMHRPTNGDEVAMAQYDNQSVEQFVKREGFGKAAQATVTVWTRVMLGLEPCAQTTSMGDNFSGLNEVGFYFCSVLAFLKMTCVVVHRHAGILEMLSSSTQSRNRSAEHPRKKDYTVEQRRRRRDRRWHYVHLQ